MARVIVEREFAEPVSFEEMAEREKAGAWCLAQHHVEYVKTYLSKDRRRMICVYEAPDAESVRIAQTKANMPFTRVWATDVIGE